MRTAQAVAAAIVIGSATVARADPATGLYTSYMAVFNPLGGLAFQPQHVKFQWSAGNLGFYPPYAHPDDPFAEVNFLGEPLQYDGLFTAPGIRITRESVYGNSGYQVTLFALSDDRGNYVYAQWCCFPADGISRSYELHIETSKDAGVSMTLVQSGQSVAASTYDPGPTPQGGWNIDLLSGPHYFWADPNAWIINNRNTNGVTTNTISSYFLVSAWNYSAGLTETLAYNGIGYPVHYMLLEDEFGTAAALGSATPYILDRVTIEDIDIQ